MGSDSIDLDEWSWRTGRVRSIESDPIAASSITTAFARRQTRTTPRPETRREIVREVTRRNTSPWGHSTFEMIRPTRLALRSRASVSVSGNSGTATVLAPADVASEHAAGERHLVGAETASLLRFGERLRHARHCKHATA